MFKVTLLTVLVSVVWSTVRATYIFTNNDAYPILGHLRINSYDGPIHQTNLGVDFANNGHDIVFPHTAGEAIRYIPHSLNSFHELSHSNGFRIPETRQFILKQFNHSPHQEQNKQTYQDQKISQRQVDVKSDNNGYAAPAKSDGSGYTEPQSKNQEYSQYPPSSGIIQQGIILGSDYFGSSGQNDKNKEATQSQKYDTESKTNSQDVTQQKIVNVEFQQSKPDPKPESKINNQNYESKSKNNEEQQKYNETPDFKEFKQVHDYNFPGYGFQNNDKIYPVFYNQNPLEHGRYIKLHDAGRYTEIPSGFGSTGTHYREIRIPDGIHYHSGLNTHGDIRPYHDVHSPILLNGNFRGHVGDHPEFLFGVRSHLGDIDTHLAYPFFGINSTQPTESNYPNYPEQKKDNSDSNYEQKPVMVEFKMVPDQQTSYSDYGENAPEYKKEDAPKYSDSSKPEMTYNTEQKPVEVGIKGSYGQDSSYDSNDQQYKDEKNPAATKYPESSTKNLMYTLEQKSVDAAIKSIMDKIESDYGSIGSVMKYPTSKISEGDTQQKSVDVVFMNGGGASDYKTLGDSASEYPGIGSIDAPKYPGSVSKKSEPKLEQKSVETETYREVKASFKSTKPIAGAYGSSKDDSDYISSKFNDLKKDIDSKISGYQTPVYVERGKSDYNKNQGYHGPSGGSSTSYFNTGHQFPGNDYGSRRDNPFTYSNSGNNIRSHYAGNSFPSSYPRSNSYGSRNPSSYGSTVSYHRPASNFPSHGNTHGSNYQRPLVTGSNNKYPHHQSEYPGIGAIPSYPSTRSISSDSSILKYQDHSSHRIPKPTYSDAPEPYNKEKFVKVSYEYPRNSLKKDESIYASSIKPNSDVKKPYSDSSAYQPSENYRPKSSGYPTHSRPNSYGPATSVSYLKMDNSGPSSSIPSYPTSSGKDDYSDGIGGIEYPGIGEKSTPSKGSDAKSAPYSPSENGKTEQKTYDSEVPTYSDTKSDAYKTSGEEYKGIGEIGSIPSSKSEIVGGRHPIKRPVKTSPSSTKTSPSGVKGKKEDKTEQKYLPITATLSDAKSGGYDSKPASKKYDQPSKPKSSVKTKTPEKIEQQEDLVYEALLAGEGPQNHASGSSGYGFNRSPSAGRRPIAHGSGYKDEDHPPMPYEFEFDIKDDEHGSEQYRREKMDDSGYLTGSYGFKDAEGIYRQVEYEASKEGFKVNKIKTNEPGTDNENPADVYFEAHKQR